MTIRRTSGREILNIIKWRAEKTVKYDERKTVLLLFLKEGDFYGLNSNLDLANKYRMRLFA
jgi:hypothetical protein